MAEADEDRKRRLGNAGSRGGQICVSSGFGGPASGFGLPASGFGDSPLWPEVPDCDGIANERVTGPETYVAALPSFEGMSYGQTKPL